MAVAWVLNLDADLELGGGDRYAPTAAVRRAMRPHVTTLCRSLTQEGDVLVDEASPPGRASGLVGRAFCPTPRAIALLRRAGATPEPHPPVVVLRRVNSRAFASALGQTLPGAVFVTELRAAHDVLARRPEVGERWRVKHAFGMSGRHQRVVGLPLDDADRAFLERGVAAGLQIEPDVPITAEYGIHGFVRRNGELLRGSVVVQRCDERGQWLASERAPEVPRFVEEQLHGEIEKVAAALRDAGYFGPFGIDAFCYRSGGGELAFQPRSEINARYSMGFAIGFGAVPAPPP